MKSKQIILAILCLLWGGCFCLFASPSALAYGGGTQQERFPNAISAEYLDGLGRTKIEQALQAAGETRRHAVSLSRSPRAVQAPAGQLICEVDLPKGISYTGLTPVTVSIYVDGSFYRRVVLYYRVRVYETVLVAARDLPIDKTIESADVLTKEVEVDLPATSYLKESKEIDGRVPARFIKAGTPVLADFLQNPIVLESGAAVTIVTQVNGVEVKTDGIAMQRGRVGKWIRVRNARSGKILGGRVIDAHTVEVG